MDRPIAILTDSPTIILRSDMGDDEIQIALSPSISDGTVIVPKIRGVNGEYPHLDFCLILDELDLAVAAYLNMLRFVTVGVLYEGCPMAWNELEDETRMRIRKAARKRNIPTETLRYSDSRYYVLEALSGS